MKNNYSTLTNTYNSNQSIDNSEVFYYNTGDPHDSNSGFSGDDIGGFEQISDFKMANFEQILDACDSGIFMPSGWYAWGSMGQSPDGSPIPFVFSCPGESFIPTNDQKYGVFCYGVKPLKNSIGNCLTNGNNVVCVLPWSYVPDKWSQWSQNDKSIPAGV